MRIEIGKRYWRRDGSLSGVVTHIGSAPYTFKAGHETYYTTGSFNSCSNHPLDLIAEYTGPELVPPSEKAKRTIMFKEILSRYGDYWVLGWEANGPVPDKRLVLPDEVLYTGNERVVEI